MPKLNKNPQAVNQKGYNAFSMSSTLDMTNTTGFIIPVHFDFLYSGDKVTFKPSLLTRTNPLAAPAQASIVENIDTFFVPLNQLYAVFGDWYNNIKDMKTDFYESAFGSSPSASFNTHLPFFKPSHEVANIIHMLLQGSAYDAENIASLRLLDALQLPIGAYFKEINRLGRLKKTSTVSDIDNMLGPNTNTVNPFFLLAYQKIYMDYYRLDDREENNPIYYNVDSYALKSDTAMNVSNRFNFYSTMRLCPWKRDFFRNVFVSPSLNPQDKNIYGIDANSLVNNWLGTYGNELSNPSFQSDVTLPVGIDKIPSLFGGDNDYLPSFTAFNVRSLFAITKMLEVTRRAGKHYDKQTLAHLGVNVPMGIAGEVFELGHHEQLMQIGDVISTANTVDAGGSPLGEIAGKGYSGNGTVRVSDEVKFTAPCEGIFMSVYYARPDAVYNQDGLPKLFTKVSAADFWHSEVDNLGMQPKFLYETHVLPNSGVDYNGRFYGWEYAWTEHKQKYNRALGDVSAYGSKSWWTLTQDTPFGPSLNYFQVQPTSLNSIMLYPFNGNMVPFELNGDDVTLHYSYIYESDPLINHFEFMYNKASKMSTYSLLNL